MRNDAESATIERISQAIREAARANAADSPLTNLEAMALAAVKELRVINDGR